MNTEFLELQIEYLPEIEDEVMALIGQFDILGMEIIDKRDFEIYIENKKEWELVDSDFLDNKQDNIICKVYFGKDDKDINSINKLSDELQKINVITKNNFISNKDWDKEWKKFYKPFVINNIHIVPEWEKSNYTQDIKEENIVYVEPGMAFGTGTHETTHLCIQELDSMDLNGSNVLDIGTGSGILSILAKKRGAKIVDACDIDLDALECAKHNVAVNNVDVNVFYSDLFSKVKNTYDFIFANLLSEILAKMLKDVDKYLSKDGELILSGILLEKKDFVLQNLSINGFYAYNIDYLGSWVVIHAKRTKKLMYRTLTLGCKVNQYETEAMEEILEDAGYSKTDSYDADVFLINTCTVTALSDSKCRQMIRKAKKLNKDAIIVVVGCYSQVAPEEIELIDGVDIIIGTKGRKHLLQFIENFIENRQQINAVTDINLNSEFDELSISTEHSMTRAYIKIQEGCNMFCTYCIIPYARGQIASRKMSNIVDEATRLSNSGYKEVVLTGIHVASYGKEKNNEGFTLTDVVENVAKVDGIERIRLSSIEPRAVTEDFLVRIKNTGKICEHFHMSLQSGSDKILKLMNRKYNKKIYLEKCLLIKKYFPDASLTTDIIAGFPGETEEDFNETLEFANQIGFSKIHAFPFSRRKGTPAYGFSNQLSNNIKKERVHKLIALSDNMCKNFLDKFIGTEQEVLFEEMSIDDNYIYGYTGNYIRVAVEYNPDLFNKIVNVYCKSQDGGIIYGEVK